MTHYNADIRVFSASMNKANGLMGLGMTVNPTTPVSGKGSRAKHYCSCLKRIGSCGQYESSQGRYHLWYAIHGVACCGHCWDEIYDRMMELTE